MQLSPSYERPATVDELAGHGELHAETAKIFRNLHSEPFRLCFHQLEALQQTFLMKSAGRLRKRLARCGRGAASVAGADTRTEGSIGAGAAAPRSAQ